MIVFTYTIITLILIIVLLASFIFAAWQLAKLDVFWTFLALGEIKAVVSGEGNPIAILANLQDHHVEKMEIVEGSPKKTFLQKRFGIYRIGWPPAKIQEFEFTHERINPEIGPKTLSSDWIKRDSMPKKTKVLLWDIPHSYMIPSIEFADQFQADVLFESRSRVVKPLIAIFIRKGKFFDFMAEYVNAGVIEVLREIPYSEFIKQEKTDGSNLSQSILAKINLKVASSDDSRLLKSVGLNMVGGFISRFEAPREITEALEAQKKATLAGKARIEAAKQDADKAVEEARRIQTLAEAKRAAAITEAEGEAAFFKTILGSVTHPAMNDEIATRMVESATQLAVATKFSNPESPVIALGTTMIGVQAREKK